MFIAICDDDSKIIDRLQEIIIDKYKDLTEEVNISVFTNGEELIDSIRNEQKSYDVVLLDVDMPGISGMETADILKTENESILIIFITSHENYVYEAFQYDAFRFIRKRKIQEELGLALKSAYTAYLKRKKRYIVIKGEAEEYRVSHSDIVFIEIVSRKLEIHLLNRKVLTTRQTIKDFISKLDNSNFVKIYESIVVNMKYVKGYNNNDVILDDGTKLLASRIGMKLLKEKLTKYWRDNI